MKEINIVILVLLILTIPVFGIGIIFGLAGSTAGYYLMISLGYLIGVVSSVLGLFWEKFRYLALVGLFLIALGIILDGMFWKKHNRELCEELRAEPSCTETEIGFSCTDFDGMDFSTGKSICH